MTDVNIDGNVISGNVAELIICMAASEVEGIAGVAGTGLSSTIKGLISANDVAGVELETGPDGGLSIGVHVEVFYGYVLPEVAAKVREAVADAVETQIGAKVDAVDVYIDAVKFVD